MFVRSFSQCIPGVCGRAAFFCVAIACLLLIPGCGESGPRMEPVSGTVTLKGAPIEGADVYFVHEQQVSVGKTDSEGHYDLVPGAVAGENKVYFSKIEGGASSEEDDGMAEIEMEAARSSGAGRKANVPKQIIPAEYSNASNPKLSFTVPSGGSTSADFEL